LPNLLKILPDDLADGLTTSEAGLMRAAAAGEMLDLRSGDAFTDSPENAGLWDAARTVRGEFLSWLCGALEYVYPRGVSVVGARVDGPVNLDSVRMEMPLSLKRCRLDDVILLDARVKSVSLEGSICGELVADGLTCYGDFVMDGLKAGGEVRLVGANVRSLFARSAEFSARKVYAFSADGLVAGSNVDLSSSTSSAWVRLLDVRIKGTLLLDGLRVDNPGAYSVSMGGAGINGNLYMRDAYLAGEFRMDGADIGGGLYISGSRVSNPGDVSIGASGISVGMDLVIERASLEGSLLMRGACIGGSLEITGSRFDGDGGDSVMAVGVSAGGGVYLRDVMAHGAVHFSGLEAGRGMYVSGSGFEGMSAALGLYKARVGGVLSIDAVTVFSGPLVLKGAKVGRFADDRDSWPEPGMLDIDGFEYGWLHGAGAKPDGESRVDWLRLMPRKPFRRGPYVRLARVLHIMGRENDMRTVVDAMYDDMKAAGEFGLLRRLWRWFMKGRGDLG